MVTEIRDNLRAALDHVAREVAGRCSVADAEGDVTFPTAARGPTYRFMLSAASGAAKHLRGTEVARAHS